jgi:hypothetical protein
VPVVLQPVAVFDDEWPPPVDLIWGMVDKVRQICGDLQVAVLQGAIPELDVNVFAARIEAGAT